MARVTRAFQDKYPSYCIEKLHNPLIFVVDMINGFVEEGALHDNAIRAIIPDIQALLESCECPAIFIADSHLPQAREFTSFPIHCVAGTSESEVVAKLQPYVKELYHKNSTNTFHCPDFQNLLKHIQQYNDIIITGCCTDICILQFALTLQSWLNEQDCQDMQIIVPIDMIDTYHIDEIHDAVMENEYSIRNMAASGVRIVKTLERGK